MEKIDQNLKIDQYLMLLHLISVQEKDVVRIFERQQESYQKYGFH